MSAERFLEAIIAEPERDDIRLIFADWLEENGQSARAEFIRVQIRLEDFARSQDEFDKADISHMDAERARLDVGQKILRRRERELLKFHGWKWAPSLPDACWECNGTHLGGAGRVFRGEFRRGFIESATLAAAAWLEHGPALVKAAPLREVRLNDHQPSHLPFVGGWNWGLLDNGLNDPRVTVPYCLLQHLPQFDHIAPPTGYWESAERAILALSVACLAWARAQNEDRP
jgi:uncharacterized protein (TIGR02996 family)